MGIASAWAWTLWGTIQAGASDLDFDFWEWAMDKMDRAGQAFAEPGFDALLDTVGSPPMTVLPDRTPPDRTPPDRARVVIGGGVIGTSVAYHLAHLGWTDVVLLEQGTLSCGTTWHAAGLVGQLRASEAGTRLVQYSTDPHARLEEETGLSTGYRVCGE